MKNTLNSYLKWLWLQLKGSRALYVLSIFFSGINNFVMPTAMSWFIKEALAMVEREKNSGVGKKVLIVVVVILLGNLLHLLFTYTKTKVVETTMHQIRLQFFRKARKLPMSYYDQNQQGKVMSISLQNMQWMQRILDTELVSFASRALTIGGGMLIVFIWQWQIGLVYLLIGSIGIGTALWVQRKLTQMEAGLQQSNGRLSALLLARIKGQREIRINQLTEKLNTEYENERMKNVEVQYQIARASTIGSTVNYGVMMGATLLSILVGVYLVQNRLSNMGTVLGCAVFMISNIWAFSSLVRVTGVLKQGLGAYGEFMRFMEEPTEEKIKEQYQPEIIIFGNEEGLILKHIDCGYGEKTVLNDVCLHVKKGQKVVLSGESGSGKSTLLKMIAGLYIPLQGDMKLEQNQYSKVSLEEWRKNVAYVSQQTHIFPGTLRDNLTLAKSTASEEEIWHAIQQAQLEEWMKSLPDGLETVLNEKRTVSGGERQRIAVARAFLKDAPLLILDEPTAALDQVNVDGLCQAIFGLMQDRMVIIASHDEALIEKADIRYIIENKKVKQINECGHSSR